MTRDETATISGTIDAIYELDDYYLEPISVAPVSSVHQQVPFDPDITYRVYFDHFDNRYKAEDDDCPHADIFIQSDGQFCIAYDFLPTATPAEVESLEMVVKTREFQRSALKQWGGFKLLWGGLGGNDTFDTGANLLVYYDDELAFVTLRRVDVQSGLTYAELLADYQFLLDIPVHPKKPANTLDIEEERGELMSLVEVDPDDDPDFLYQWVMPT